MTLIAILIYSTPQKKNMKAKKRKPQRKHNKIALLSTEEIISIRVHYHIMEFTIQNISDRFNIGVSAISDLVFFRVKPSIPGDIDKFMIRSTRQERTEQEKTRLLKLQARKNSPEYSRDIQIAELDRAGVPTTQLAKDFGLKLSEIMAIVLRLN